MRMSGVLARVAALAFAVELLRAQAQEKAQAWAWVVVVVPESSIVDHNNLGTASPFHWV